MAAIVKTLASVLQVAEAASRKMAMARGVAATVEVAEAAFRREVLLRSIASTVRLHEGNLRDLPIIQIPPGITEMEIYKRPEKTAGKVRVRIRLDDLLCESNFVDEFAGSVLDTALWSSWRPPNTSITVSGGEVLLQSTDDTNGFPVVQSLPGKTFPLDRSIPWTLEWTMRFPVLTDYGVMFRVCDLEQVRSLVEIECNNVAGLTVEFPAGTWVEQLGNDTGSHSFELIYTPATNSEEAQYELKRDGASKGTLDATDRQAWFVMFGNGSIQTFMGSWTQIAVSRVDVNMTGAESQSYPDWTDKETLADGSVWGRLPWLSRLSIGTHKRNIVDQAVLTLPQGGYVTGVQGDVNGPGYRSNMFAGFRWGSREIRVETQQSDGRHQTSWKERFRGYCDEPRAVYHSGLAMLEIVARDKARRRLQMSHLVRSFSDAAGGIDGVVMNMNWPQIIRDICEVVGLGADDYYILDDPLRPRSWQILGTSALEEIVSLAEQGVAALFRNTGQTYPGRLEVREWEWGDGIPDFTLHVDSDLVGLDYAETIIGNVAQVVETVQHSEFSEFSDIFPHAPVPPFGAQIRHNAAIAQVANDINSVRILPALRWKNLNRENFSLVAQVVGQDWMEHNLQCQVIDPRILGIPVDEYWIVDGFDEQWDATNGWRTSTHLVNQKPHRTIMRNRQPGTVQVVYG